MEWGIGQKIRVLGVDGEISHRAMISFINEDGMVDVIYTSKLKPSTAIEGEESNIPASRLLRLEHFEVDEETTMEPISAGNMKDRGNAVFSRKDFECAEMWYRRALSTLTPPLSVGADVLVYMDTSKLILRSAMVSDVSASLVDVVFEDDTISGDGTPIDCVVVLAKDQDMWQVQRAVYLNLCRCSLKRSQFGWAVHWSTLALGTAMMCMERFGDTKRKGECDALFLRAKALLSAGKLARATADASSLARWDSTRAQALMKDIEGLKQRRKNLNKKLAVDVAKWVDTAMKISEEKKRVKTAAGADRDGDMGGGNSMSADNDDDIDLDHMIEGEEWEGNDGGVAEGDSKDESSDLSNGGKSSEDENANCIVS